MNRLSSELVARIGTPGQQFVASGDKSGQQFVASDYTIGQPTLGLVFFNAKENR